MNIGLMIYGALDTVSGGYLYDRIIVDHLQSRGARVKIISQRQRNYFLNLTDNLSFSLPAKMRHADLDVLLQDELNHPSLFLLNRRLRKSMDIPIISIVHHLRSSESHHPFLNMFYRMIEKQYLKTLDGFICNSESTRRAVYEKTVKPFPSVVAYPGRDHIKPSITRDEIISRCRQPGPLQILFIGNVIPRKGLHSLIDALARIPQQDWHLTVAGSLSTDAGYTQIIRRKISEARLTNNINLLDTLTIDALIPLLERHHCLAVPSYYEGFGIVYLEAMGFGMPVIAGASGGTSELIRDRQEGFLLPPGNVDLLANCIGTLMEDRKMLLNMSIAAYKRYYEHPTWSDTAVHIYDFLCKIIELKVVHPRKG